MEILGRMTHRKELHFQPVAGILACILPGLGHCFLGEAKRGVFVFIGVAGLFFGGMLVGGIDVIDRKEDKWWFLLQAGAGPMAFAIDSIHQNSFKVEAREGGRSVRRSGLPEASRNPGGEPARSRKSLGKVNEVGSLAAAMGGMMNMIAIIDALWYPPIRRRRGSGGGSGSTQGGGPA